MCVAVTRPLVESRTVVLVMARCPEPPGSTTVCSGVVNFQPLTESLAV